MRGEMAIWVAVGVGAALVTVLMTLSGLTWGVALFALVGLVAAHRIGRWVTSPEDRNWLPAMVTFAYLAHLVGAWIRYYFVTVVYQGGDSLAYHRAALEMVTAWRDFEVPVATGGGPGTRFVETVTSLVYVPAEPSLLVGYFVFASLGFVGSVLLYLAFRIAVPTAHLRRYALLIFFLPSLLFWPTSIGKEALMMFGIGTASYGVAALLAGTRIRAATFVTVGVVGMAAIRPHVAVMLVASLVVALIFSRRIGVRFSTRLVVGLITVAAVWWLSALAMTQLGLEPGESGLDEFLLEQERLTQQGGSAVVGAPVRNPVDLPEATLRVLFRPLPNEAHNAQAMMSALENVALLALILWRLPSLWRHRSMLRSYPYLLFSLAFVGQFVIAFSSIFNLGILARQRVQALPFLLAVVVAMGWGLRTASATGVRPASLGPRLHPAHTATSR